MPKTPATAEEQAALDAAAAEAAKKAEAEAAAKAAADEEAARLLAEVAAAEAAASDPHYGVFVGFGATAHGNEDGMYAVDPDTGCITGPYTPPDPE